LIGVYNKMTGSSFNEWTYTLYLYSSIGMWALTGLVALAGIIFMILKKMTNWTLVALEVTLILITIVFVPTQLLFLTPASDNTIFRLGYIILFGAPPLAHWIVSYAYLLAVAETEALLDIDIYFSNIEKLSNVDQKKHKLGIASVIVMVLCLIDGIVAYYAWITPTYIAYYFASYFSLVINLIFLALWGVALIKLNKQVKNAKALFPNRKLFLLHGITLVLAGVFELLGVLTYQIAQSCKNHGKDETGLYWQGSAHICTIISVLFLCAGFWLVNYVMLPVTNKHVQR